MDETPDHVIEADLEGNIKPEKEFEGKIPPEVRKAPFLYWAHRKIHYHEEDCLVAVVGKTGYGKSTLALRFAEALDRDASGQTRFNIDHVIYGMKEFQKMLSQKHPIGSAFVLEEPQTFLNSRDSMTRKNINALRLFSTGRVFRNYIFLTYPKFNRIDKQIRELLHAVVEVQRPDREQGVSNYVPYLLDSNDSGEIYRWKFRVRQPDSVNPTAFKERRVDLWKDILPSQTIRDAYETKSVEWKEGIRKGLVGFDGSFMTFDELIKPVEYSSGIQIRQRNKEVDEVVEKYRDTREQFMKNGRYVVNRISTKAGRSPHFCNWVAERFRLLDEKAKHDE